MNNSIDQSIDQSIAQIYTASLTKCLIPNWNSIIIMRTPSWHKE